MLLFEDGKTSPNAKQSMRFRPAYLPILKRRRRMAFVNRIGYCNPPQSTRFKKGQSGNPKGRPKGSCTLRTALDRALRERVRIKENGKYKSISKGQVVMKQLVNLAASGNLVALRLVLTI